MKYKIKNIIKTGTLIVLVKVLLEDFWKDYPGYNFYVGFLALTTIYMFFRIFVLAEEQKTIRPIIETIIVLSALVGVGFLISYLFDMSASMVLSMLSIGSILCSNRKSVFSMCEPEASDNKSKPVQVKKKRKKNKTRKSKVVVHRKKIRW